MDDKNNKDFDDIDFSVLEKIKEMKTDKKAQLDSASAIDLLDEDREPYVEDKHFERLIETQIDLFNNTLTPTENTLIQKSLDRRADNKHIIKLKNESSKHHGNKLNWFKTKKFTFTDEALDQAVLDHDLANISDRDLLKINLKCAWIKHANTRFDERIMNSYGGQEKKKIEDFLIRTYNSRSLNQGQEYELLYRTDKVQTYKIVCFLEKSIIVIKTLYRIDKESKEEYQENLRWRHKKRQAA